MKLARVALPVTVGATCALFLFGTSALPPAQAQTETVLFSFTTSGEHPAGSLLFDSSGNIYGATSGGGPVPGGYGSVYELVNSSGSYTQEVLHTFGATSTDGLNPWGGVVMDSAGNVYGTTYNGGSAGKGTAFELVKSGGSYIENVLYNFGATSGDGLNPNSDLLMDVAGNIFGTTAAGGAANLGTVFELVNTSGTYTEKVLYSFAGPPSDGEAPVGLLMDSAGNLFGATGGGGTSNNGTVFELVNGSGTYTEKLLYSFAGPPDGRIPTGLVMDSSGNLYGMTRTGGASLNCCGTVFELVNSSGNYTEKILYSFTSADGMSPAGAPILDPANKIYGPSSTIQGGAIFELTNSSGSYAKYVLHAFTGYPSDGMNPGNLVLDSGGNLYGSTGSGGSNGSGFGGFGTVFEIPNASALSVIFTPNALNFGDRLMGTPATTQSITVNNIGTAGLTFGASAVTRSGANLADFTINSDGCSGHTLAPATGTCTVSVTYTPGILGSETASLSFADNGFGNPQTVPLSGMGQDFSLTPIDTTGTATRPSSATFQFNINPLGGFTGTVTTSCSNLPPNTACLPGQPVLVNGITTDGVTVETNASAEAIPRSRNQFSPPPVALWIFFAGLAVTSLLVRRRSSIRVLAPFALTVLAASCGAAGSGHSGYHGPQTPTGTYTITISATSSGLTHSFNATLIVQ